MAVEDHTFEEQTGCVRGKIAVTFVPVLIEKQMEIVESLAREIWIEHYTSIIGREQVDYMLTRFQSRDAIGKQIGDGVLYFLMEADGQFIGYLAAQPRGCELFLGKIYVRSSDRMRGFARKALLFLEDLARSRGLGKISLTVNRNNTGSIRAYEKLGFKNCGPVIQDIGEGFFMDDYRMEKIVSCKVQEDK